MKRFIAVVMTLVLVLTAFPISALAVETKAQKEEIFVRYEEFRDNEAYYWNQVKTQHKRVYIYVGDEYKEEVQNAFNSSIVNDSEMAEKNQTRGQEKPLSEWNVAVRGTYTSDETYAYSNSVYTNYQFRGLTSYGIQVFNAGEVSDATIRIHGGPFEYGGNDIVVYPGFVMLDLLITERDSDRFYLEFTPPCSHCWAKVGAYSELANS